MRQAVVTAATLFRRRVCATRGAARGGDTAAEEQALTLVAITPVGLTQRVGGRVVWKAVVAAAALLRRRVRTARRATGGGKTSTEEQAVTLVAPTPVGLTLRVGRHAEWKAVLAAATLLRVRMRAAQGAARKGQPSTEEQALALAAPTPIRLNLSEEADDPDREEGGTLDVHAVACVKQEQALPGYLDHPLGEGPCVVKNVCSLKVVVGAIQSRSSV